MVMRIARLWNQHPNWFYTLDQETQVKVLAEYRLYNESEKQKKDRQERIKRDRMEMMIRRQRGE
jgi:hypothetical protein